MSRGLLCAFCFCVFAATLPAATIQVPGGQPTIQGAINVAVSGDTVLVSQGTYVENIDFLGKAITVISESGPDLTVIDGGQAGSVVTFTNGEGSSSVIEGFTITNGTGTPDALSKMSGGGIFCDPAVSPVIRGNTIRDNNCWNGAGIYCGNGSSPLIEGNFITNNTCKNGGGVDCVEASMPIIRNNVITFNEAPVYGGGIRCFTGCDATIENNLITDNDARSISGTSGRGGGIYCYQAEPHIIGNTILNNKSTKCGGGIYCKTCAPLIEYNVINNNETEAEYGGAIQCSTYADVIVTGNVMMHNKALLGGSVNCYNYSEPVLTNNIIAFNYVTNAGGGINCLEFAKTTIVNCTLYKNEAALGGGGISVINDADTTMVNSIIWGNISPVGRSGLIGTDTTTGTLTISHSDVEGGQSYIKVNTGSTLNWGTNMIDLDPRFVEPARGDLHINARSPCLGLGDNTFPGLPAQDFEGDDRIVSFVTDMGADEFSTRLYAIGSVVAGQPVTIRTIGTPGKPVLLGLGSAVRNPPIKIQYEGFLHLVTPLLNSWSLGTLNTDGTVTLNATVPAGWASGSEHPFQALVGPLGSSSSELTNLLNLIVE